MTQANLVGRAEPCPVGRPWTGLSPARSQWLLSRWTESGVLTIRSLIHYWALGRLLSLRVEVTTQGEPGPEESGPHGQTGYKVPPVQRPSDSAEAYGA